MHLIDVLQLKFHAIWSTTTLDMRIKKAKQAKIAYL
jgi:hypothetical protein